MKVPPVVTKLSGLDIMDKEVVVSLKEIYGLVQSSRYCTNKLVKTILDMIWFNQYKVCPCLLYINCVIIATEIVHGMFGREVFWVYRIHLEIWWEILSVAIIQLNLIYMVEYSFMDDVQMLIKYTMLETLHDAIVKFDHGGFGYKRQTH